MIPSMKTGLLDADDDESVPATIAALLRLFATESCTVACKYVHADRRGAVEGADMKKALQYVARTFFEQSDQELYARVSRELERMEDESSDESSDEGSDEGSDESGCDDGESRSSASDAQCKSDSEDCRSGSRSPSPATCAVARHVDDVDKVWHLWSPDDPVQRLIKTAIDKVPVPAAAPDTTERR